MEKKRGAAVCLIAAVLFGAGAVPCLAAGDRDGRQAEYYTENREDRQAEKGSANRNEGPAVPVDRVRAKSRESMRREEREKKAEAAAREILGSGTPLTKAERGGLLLFTCRNGYALVDPADGSVAEYALSFPGREPVYRRGGSEPYPAGSESDSGDPATK